MNIFILTSSRKLRNIVLLEYILEFQYTRSHVIMNPQVNSNTKAYEWINTHSRREYAPSANDTSERMGVH